MIFLAYQINSLILLSRLDKVCVSFPVFEVRYGVEGQINALGGQNSQLTVREANSWYRTALGNVRRIINDNSGIITSRVQLIRSECISIILANVCRGVTRVVQCSALGLTSTCIMLHNAFPVLGSRSSAKSQLSPAAPYNRSCCSSKMLSRRSQHVDPG
jgi:hypothetical protein